MVYTVESQNTDGSYDTYFLNTHAVGKNSANFWADIQMVQYLIRTVYQLNAFGIYGEGSAGCWNVSEVTKNDIYDLPNPPTDYRNLKKTIKWIEYFQADALLHNNFYILNDGKVPAVDYKLFGYGKHYTIHLLNIVVQQSYKSIGFEDYAQYMLDDPGLGSFAKAQILSS